MEKARLGELSLQRRSFSHTERKFEKEAVVQSRAERKYILTSHRLPYQKEETSSSSRRGDQHYSRHFPREGEKPFRFLQNQRGAPERTLLLSEGSWVSPGEGGCLRHSAAS